MARLLLQQTVVLTPIFCKQPAFFTRVSFLSGNVNYARLPSFIRQTKPLLCSSVNFSTLPTKASCCIGSSKLLDPFEQKKKPCTQSERGMATNFKQLATNLVEDMKLMKQAPYPALVLGMSGLVPIAFAPLYMLIAGFGSSIAFAHVAYCATILSYLGGGRWGYVLPELCQEKQDWVNLGSSVAPPLMAWTALLMPMSLCQLVLLGGFAGSTYYDSTLKCYPSWLKGLRITLGCSAVVSLGLTFIFGFILRCKDGKKPAKEIK